MLTLQQSRFAPALLGLILGACTLVVRSTGAAATLAVCSAGPIHNGTGCTMNKYATPRSPNATACCSLCAADKRCRAWTFHRDQEQCYLGEKADCRRVGGAVGGCKHPCAAPAPAPPAPVPGPPPPIPFPTYCKGKDKKCKNILYFVSDDMRSDWGAYGLPVVTPNLDQLASKSMLFEHAYCQISVCAPSRMSFMTSKRPDTNGVWNFIDTNPLTTQATPGHFRDHGYITLGLGKTFHQDFGAWNAAKYWSLVRVQLCCRLQQHCK